MLNASYQPSIERDPSCLRVPWKGVFLEEKKQAVGKLKVFMDGFALTLGGRFTVIMIIKELLSKPIITCPENEATEPVNHTTHFIH